MALSCLEVTCRTFTKHIRSNYEMKYEEEINIEKFNKLINLDDFYTHKLYDIFTWQQQTQLCHHDHMKNNIKALNKWQTTKKKVFVTKKFMLANKNDWNITISKREHVKIELRVSSSDVFNWMIASVLYALKIW